MWKHNDSASNPSSIMYLDTVENKATNSAEFIVDRQVILV